MRDGGGNLGEVVVEGAEKRNERVLLPFLKTSIKAQVLTR